VLQNRCRQPAWYRRYLPTYASLKKRRNAYVHDSLWQRRLQRLLQKVPSHEW
jgi:hypothetical protein